VDVKFTNQLCNCAPSKIEGYGAYKWTNPSKLRRIPPLPLELFNMTKEKQKRAAPAASSSSSSSGGSATATAPDEARPQNMEDIEALCRCITDSQMDDWAAWSKLGLILKKLGAPYSLWQTMSARSKKFDGQQCEDWWKKAKIHNYTMNSLRTLAKEGNTDEYARINPFTKQHQKRVRRWFQLPLR
jgi:hypothetical protein